MYYLNKHGAKRNAEYFYKNMLDKMPSHIQTIYDASGVIIWTR